jgi:hypothetical protein
MIQDLDKMTVDIETAKRVLAQTMDHDGLPPLVTCLIDAGWCEDRSFIMSYFLIAKIGFFAAKEPFLLNLLKLSKATMVTVFFSPFFIHQYILALTNVY